MKPAFFQLILCAISGSALASATSTGNGTATTANSTSTGSLAGTSPGTLAGSAFSTCTNIGFSSTTISASCPDANMIFHSSSINTNNCIGNNDGNLVHGNKYASTCSAITFTPSSANGVSLSAACKNKKGQEVQASVDLGTFIINNGGTLTCA
ncbi:hypothetical protein B0H13DRAFT_2427625 [Mycena leptocephala]|nr:hypothetical protein B0H13DRAFT_2427625 [Mycena leptocephala]